MVVAETVRRHARGTSSRSAALLVAIAGDSASGKTTFARGLEGRVGRARVRHIRGDDYHRYDRRTRTSLGLTPLHPDANDLDRMAEDLDRLSRGRPILAPVYDHATGNFGDPRPVDPGEVVVVEGLLALGTRALRDLFDLSVYLEPEEELRHGWKIRRDCAERGYDIRAVVNDLRCREADADRFVRPQREVADIVISVRRGSSAAPVGATEAAGGHSGRRGARSAPGAALNALLS
jgi:phosphoribulokinase